MGNEATVRAKVQGKLDQGHALLEVSEVVFRGTQRCVVRLEEVRATATVAGGWLKLDRNLELELGPDLAEKWLEKIRNPRTVLQKLGVKRGQRVRLINLDEPELVAELIQAGALISDSDTEADVFFFMVRDAADLKKLPKVTRDEVLWVLRTKGRNATVGERETMAAGKAAGLVDVKVVGFSETLSAEKYVVPLKKRK